jgi:hypothetical protein
MFRLLGPTTDSVKDIQTQIHIRDEIEAYIPKHRTG